MPNPLAVALTRFELEARNLKSSLAGRVRGGANTKREILLAPPQQDGDR